MPHNLTFDHPYWHLYQHLLIVDWKGENNQKRKDMMRQLANQAEFTDLDKGKLEAMMMLPWFKPEMAHRLFFDRLRERYCYSVLRPDTLNLIANFSPIVELGAGNGYNAWLLRQIGAEVVALEAFPPEEGKNWFFGTNVLGMPKKGATSWTKIAKGGALDLGGYTNHALFISWPPINSMASEAIDNYDGEIIILIANRANCATSDFYKRLLKDWHLVYSTETGGWKSLQVEWLELYCRDREGHAAQKVLDLVQHNHSHEHMRHSHVHLHDEHHLHSHGGNVDFTKPHSHEHDHSPLDHSHPHIIDFHHHDHPE